MGEAYGASAELLADWDDVAEVGRQDGLEKKAKVELRVAQALLADRKPACLAYEQVCPLDDHDRDPVRALCVRIGLVLNHARCDVEALAHVFILSVSRYEHVRALAAALAVEHVVNVVIERSTLVD